jgi:hypothetical protein
MKGRAVVQANAFAEISQRDPIAIARYLFQNSEGAPYRLKSPARAILNVIIDVRQGMPDNTRGCGAIAGGAPRLNVSF